MPAVLPNMVAGTYDPEQILLVKIAYWLQTRALADGATDDGVMLPSMSPQFNDSRQVLLVKIAYWAEQIAGGGGGGGGGFTTGAVNPEGVETAEPGALYRDTVTGFTYLKITGSGNTGWSAI